MMTPAEMLQPARWVGALRRASPRSGVAGSMEGEHPRGSMPGSSHTWERHDQGGRCHVVMCEAESYARG